MAPFDGKYVTSYLMAIIMFTLSPLTRFHEWNKMKKVVYQNEGQGQWWEKWDLHNSTGNVLLHIADFFSELNLPGNIR